MQGKVEEWTMTEEQRLAYIEKHPIRPRKNKRSSSIDTIDYQWRGKKAAAAQKGKKKK